MDQLLMEVRALKAFRDELKREIQWLETTPDQPPPYEFAPNHTVLRVPLEVPPPQEKKCRSSEIPSPRSNPKPLP